MQEKDTMLELCVKQGYVPNTCTLDGMIVFGLVNKGEDPCSGCNKNRDVCKGRRKSYDNYDMMDGLDFLFNKEKREREERAKIQREKEEKEKIERQKKHLSVTNLYRLMEVAFEHRSGVEIIIKDLINEKAYCVKKIESFRDAIYYIVHYTRRFQIQQIYIELNGGLEPMYDELKDEFEKENIDCDIVPFYYRPLRENTVLYHDMPKNEDSYAKFLYLSK